MSATQQEPCDTQESVGASAAAARTSPAATEHQESTEKRCCDCSAGARCEVQKCPCVGNRACSTCAPLGANKCENGASAYMQGKRAARTTSASAAASSSAAAAASTAITGSPSKPPRTRKPNGVAAAAEQAAAAAASAVSYAESGAEEKNPPCFDAVREWCDSVNNSGASRAAGVSPPNWDQFANIEKLLREFTRVQGEARRFRAQFKDANKTAATSQAALAKSMKENAGLARKYNETTAKLKTAEASKPVHTSGGGSNKRGRERGVELEEAHRGGNDGTAAASPSTAAAVAHISKDGDRRRQRMQQTVHPERRQLVPQAINSIEHQRVQVQRQQQGPLNFSPSSRAAIHDQSADRAFDSRTFPASQCLVASGVGVRIHTPNPEVLHQVNQLFVNLGLVRTEDQGTTKAIDIHALREQRGSSGPIQWKVIFKSEEAAEKVLDRNMRTPNPTIMLRAFVHRGQSLEAQLQRPAGGARDTVQLRAAESRHHIVEFEQEQPVTRTLSQGSVVCVEPGNARQVQIAPFKQETASMQFTTRRTSERQQHASSAQPPGAASEPQQVHSHHPVTQPVTAPPAAGVGPGGCGHMQCHGCAHTAHGPQMMPMMPMYHSGGPTYGPFMQPPRPYYSAPMGYAAGGYMHGSEVYPPFHHQF